MAGFHSAIAGSGAVLQTFSDQSGGTLPTNYRDNPLLEVYGHFGILRIKLM